MSWRTQSLTGFAALALASALLVGGALQAGAADSVAIPPPDLPLIAPQPDGGSGGGAMPPPPPPPSGPSFPPPDSGCCGGGGNKGNPGGEIAIPGGPPIDQPGIPAFFQGEAVVVFRGTDPVEIGTQFAADHDSSVVDYFRLSRLGAHVFLLSVAGARPYETVLAEMSGDPRPLWVQRNLEFLGAESTLQSTGGSSPGTQYALERLHIGSVQSLTMGAGVKVAMVDSGVDPTHPALSGVRLSVVDVIKNNTRPTPEAHGTAIAGIIAGRNGLHGVAPDAELVAIRAFHQSGKSGDAARSSSYYVSKGVSRALDEAVRVINLSLTGPQDRLVTQTVEQALLARIVVVAAAGNAGPKAPPAYPAAQAGVIAVTATDGKDRLYKHANRGSYVTLAAPGVDILVADPGGGYDYMSGTSMAAAYVSGFAVLMIARDGSLTPSKVRKVMEATATDLGPPNRDPQFGAGRVDADAAFRQLAVN